MIARTKNRKMKENKDAPASKQNGDSGGYVVKSVMSATESKDPRWGLDSQSSIAGLYDINQFDVIDYTKNGQMTRKSLTRRKMNNLGTIVSVLDCLLYRIRD